MYRHFSRFGGWIGIRAGLLILATLACDEPTASQKPHPTATAAPLRIVSLSPELTRLVVEFGLANQIVGVDAASHSLPELESAIDLGDVDNLDVSVVEALKPNFVLVLGEKDKTSFTTALRERGIPLYVCNPTSANAVIQSIQDLGMILDQKDRARAVVRRLTRETSRIATERDGEKRPNVAWILQRDPLIVVGNRGPLHEMLELAGGEISIHRVPGERIEVSIDELAASNPDLILDSTPQSRHEPIAMGIRTEVLPAWISELPMLDILERIQIIHGLLYPPQ